MTIKLHGFLHATVALPLILAAGLGTGCGQNSNGMAGNGGSSGTGGSSGGSGGSGAAGVGADAHPIPTCSLDGGILPESMVSVPSGSFQMGCNSGDTRCDSDESPAHTVTLSAYQIDAREVTQAQYLSCLRAGRCTYPECEHPPQDFDPCDRPAFPVVCVTWQQAQDYCQFVGRRLPTEAEWEHAARGPSNTTFPWGSEVHLDTDASDCPHANMQDCYGHPGTSQPVDMQTGMDTNGRDKRESGYHAFNMAGNVVEYVFDFYDPYYYAQSPATNPQGPASGGRHVGRGGGCVSPWKWIRSTDRDDYATSDAQASLGFRCAQ